MPNFQQIDNHAENWVKFRWVFFLSGTGLNSQSSRNKTKWMENGREEEKWTSHSSALQRPLWSSILFSCFQAAPLFHPCLEARWAGLLYEIKRFWRKKTDYIYLINLLRKKLEKVWLICNECIVRLLYTAWWKCGIGSHAFLSLPVVDDAMVCSEISAIFHCVWNSPQRLLHKVDITITQSMRVGRRLSFVSVDAILSHLYGGSQIAQSIRLISQDLVSLCQPESRTLERTSRTTEKNDTWFWR